MSLETFRIALDYGRSPSVCARDKAIVLYASTSSVLEDDGDTMWISAHEIHAIADSLQEEYPGIGWPELRDALDAFEKATGIKSRLGHDPDAPTPDPFGRKREHKTLAQVMGMGYVYLIRSGERYKIGVSRNPRQRQQTLARQSPFPLEHVHEVQSLRYREIEAELHRVFSMERVHGEWFDFLEDEIPDVIRAMNELAEAEVI